MPPIWELFWNNSRPQHKELLYVPYSLQEVCGFLLLAATQYREDVGDRAFDLLSLLEETRRAIICRYLCCIFLGYLNTLTVGPVWGKNLKPSTFCIAITHYNQIHCPYWRKLRAIICRCLCHTFSLVILTPWLLVQSGAQTFNFMHSNHTLQPELHVTFIQHFSFPESSNTKVYYMYFWATFICQPQEWQEQSHVYVQLVR